MVGPTQTTVPRLRRVAEDYKNPPPTYCMEPLNMKVDLYDLGNEDSELQDFVQRKAPAQHGVWMLHPSYSKSIPFFFDVKTQSVWNRGGTPCSHETGWNRDLIIQELGSYSYPDEIRWLHCQRLNDINSGILRFSVLVTDYVDMKGAPHYERRKSLETLGFPQLGIKCQPVVGKHYLIPEFPEPVADDLWGALHLQNQEWKIPFYNGIVAKQADGIYAIQTADAFRSNLVWQYHPFDNAF